MTYSQTHWSLAELFSPYDGSDVQAAFDQVQGRVAEFGAARSGLKPDLDAAQFLEMLRVTEGIKRTLDTLTAFANLSFSANT